MKQLEPLVFILIAVGGIGFFGRRVLLNRRDPGGALIRIGRTLEKQGRYEDALTNYHAAEKKFRSAEMKAGLAKALFLQGLIYKYKKKYERAMKLFLEAETLCREIGDRESLGHDLMCMGETREAEEGFQDAEQYIKDAIEIWKALKFSDHYAYANFRLGAIQRVLGKYEEAICTYEKAYKVYKRNLQMENVSQIYIEKAVCRLKMSDQAAALEDYRHAEKLLYRAGSMEGVSEMKRRIKKLEAKI